MGEIRCPSSVNSVIEPSNCSFTVIRLTAFILAMDWTVSEYEYLLFFHRIEASLFSALNSIFSEEQGLIKSVASLAGADPFVLIN